MTVIPLTQNSKWNLKNELFCFSWFFLSFLFPFFDNDDHWTGVVAHAYNLITWEDEAEGFWGWGQLGLHRKAQSHNKMVLFWFNRRGQIMWPGSGSGKGRSPRTTPSLVLYGDADRVTQTSPNKLQDFAVTSPRRWRKEANIGREIV